MQSLRRGYHHTPTNKQLKGGVQGLADTRPKKGHLTNQERKKDDKQSATGVLVHILRKKIDSDGWIVDVGTGKNKSRYHCVNGTGGMYIPDSNVTDTMYVPKVKTEVNIDIDKKSKIYTITKIISDKKISLASFEDMLYISTNNNENTNQDVNASIVMTKDIVNLKANEIIIEDNDGTEINLIQTTKQQQESVQQQQQAIEELQESNKQLSSENTSLLQRVEILEETLKSVTNDDTEEETDDNESVSNDTNNNTSP